MKTIKENVKELLEENIYLRDNESQLCYNYYLRFCSFYSLDVISVLFSHLQDKKIPSMQTLMRISRQLQEQNPELRGLEWEKRQRKQKKVKEELGYNVNS